MKGREDAIDSVSTLATRKALEYFGARGTIYFMQISWDVTAVRSHRSLDLFMIIVQ